MITRYTPIRQMLDEFRADREKARYWQKKLMNRENIDSKSFKNFKQSFYGRDKDCRSEVFEYNSPQYGNTWLLWWRFISQGYGCSPQVKDYQVMYYLTEQFMVIILPTMIWNEQGMMKGVTLFTDHLFQRMADPERLGVDMSDRKAIIQNFVEIAMAGLIDIRDPRPGEKHRQAICRLPGAFLKGHMIYVKDTYLLRFNTFIPEKTMTPSQWRFVKSFAKIADEFKAGGSKSDFFEMQESSYINEHKQK